MTLFDIYIKRPNGLDIIIAAGINMQTLVKLTTLDPNEVAWAIEEDGRCDTDVFTIVESCDACVKDGMLGLKLPTSLLEDMNYVNFIDMFATFLSTKLGTVDEYESTLNLFGIQVQRICGFPLHNSDDFGTNGETIQ